MRGHFIFEYYLAPAERVFENKNKNPWEKPGKGKKHSWNTLGTPPEHLQDTRNSPEYPPEGPGPVPSGWPMRDLQYFQ